MARTAKTNKKVEVKEETKVSTPAVTETKIETTANLQQNPNLAEAAMTSEDIKVKGNDSNKRVDIEDVRKAAAEKAKSKHKSNIKFVGTGKPENSIAFGLNQFIMLGADAQEQKDGFFHEDAETIIEMFPDLYEKA